VTNRGARRFPAGRGSRGSRCGMPTAGDEAAITELVTRRLAAENADRVIFYAEPIDIPGWRPYYTVIAAACADLGITLEVELVS